MKVAERVRWRVQEKSLILWGSDQAIQDVRRRRRELRVSLQPRVKYKTETTCWTKNPSKEDVVQGYASNATVYFLLTKLLLTNNKHCCNTRRHNVKGAARMCVCGDTNPYSTERVPKFRRQNFQQSSNLRESVRKAYFHENLSPANSW